MLKKTVLDNNADLGLIFDTDVDRAGAVLSVRPDLDNLEKNLFDVLTRLNFWTDDSLVTEKLTSKWWGPKPGIDIEIRPTAF